MYEVQSLLSRSLTAPDDSLSNKVWPPKCISARLHLKKSPSLSLSRLPGYLFNFLRTPALSACIIPSSHAYVPCNSLHTDTCSIILWHGNIRSSVSARQRALPFIQTGSAAIATVTPVLALVLLVLLTSGATRFVRRVRLSGALLEQTIGGRVTRRRRRWRHMR